MHCVYKCLTVCVCKQRLISELLCSPMKRKFSDTTTPSISSIFPKADSSDANAKPEGLAGKKHRTEPDSKAAKKTLGQRGSRVQPLHRRARGGRQAALGTQNSSSLVQALIDEFDRRFPADNRMPAVLHRLFALHNVPKLGSERAAEIAKAHAFYEAILLGVSQEELQQEYGTFCSHVSALRRLQPELKDTADVLHHWLTSSVAQSCPSITILVQISLVIPVASAEAERVFSAMNRIKDDERSLLGDSMLNHLLMITKNGPPLEEYDFERAVYCWFCRGHRRETLGAGILQHPQQRYGSPPALPAPPAPAAPPPAAVPQVAAPPQAPVPVPAPARAVVDLVMESDGVDG